VPVQTGRISHYEILRPLGKGGMGEVFLAHDTILDRNVAIKFLPENIQSDPAARDRFLREAKAAAALDHPFICKIYETGEIEGRAFIVMEYVEGRNLRETLDEERPSPREALQITLEVAEALEVAHSKGIVHRDLKPANIMCTPQGHAKVMDFGIAKRVHTAPQSIEATLTQTAFTQQGMIMGTLDYMSPEQARGDVVDGRSDIFSLGVILYEMLSGKAPFSRPTPVETLTAVLKDPPPALAIKPKTVAPELHHILKKCLAKNPSDRYENVRELSAEVSQARDELAGGMPLFLKRWWPAVGAVVLALVGLVVWRFVVAPKAPAAGPAPEPVPVLVADFDNRTGDPIFNGAVEQAIILGLEDASFIDIFKREDARKKASQLDPHGAGKLDVKLGQLVCRSEGIPVLVTGSIESEKSGVLTLKAQAIDPVSSKIIVEDEQSVGKKADIPRAAAGLAGPICEKLGGKNYKAAKEIAEETFTTSSLEAMSAYSKAQELSKLGKNAEAIQEYQQALAADPNFGRAYSGLTAIYFNTGERKKAEECHQMALARLDSMNERERFRTRGVWYLITGDYHKAIDEYSTLVKKFPADAAGRLNLALAYFYSRDMAKAVEMGAEFTKIYPRNVNGYFNLSWYAIAAGDFVMALDQAKKALELNPQLQKAYVTAALAELAQGNNAECAAWYEKLEPIDFWAASLAVIGLADLALFEGRLNDAAGRLEKGVEADMKNSRPDMAAEKWIMLGQTRLGQGQMQKAAEAAGRALALLQDLNIAFPAAEIYIQTGQEDKAATVAQNLAKELAPESQAYAKIIDGLLAEKKDRRNEGIAAYTESLKIVDSWLGRLILGRAYLEAEAYAEAHSEFELCFKRRGEAASIFLNDIPSFRYMPQVYYYLGRVQEGLKSPAARESYEQYLKIKEKSEADPLAADARKRLGER
jgi:tetratricopeptide (TPR) repeat protein/predicted Ser/Thr protein kinase